MTRGLPFLSAMVAAMVAGPLAAAVPDLPMPSPATPTGEETEALSSARLPTGPWTPEGLQALDAEGRVVRRAFTVGSGALTTLQILRPARRALEDAGFETLYSCESAVCGGFDFRFALDLIDEPRMHVDIGDYRYHLARRDVAAGEETVALLASRSAAVGFLHVTTVVPAAVPAAAGPGPAPPGDGDAAEGDRNAPSGMSLSDLPLPAAPPDGTATAPPGGDLADRLAAEGHAVLEGLTFDSGAARLGPGGEASLAALADWMRANGAARIVLVGHTDATGDAEANRRLSRSRAAAVARALVETHGIAAGRLSSDGAGYLSPRAPNDTAEGRAANRRVEAVVLP